MTAAEVFLIAARVEKHWSADDVQALRARVEAAWERTRRLTSETRKAAMVACPLLVEDRCSVYPIRPLPCRGYNSTDAEACKAFLRTAGGEVPARLQDVVYCSAIERGLHEALQEAGLDEPRDLISGLHVALTQPDAHERWLRGERVFSQHAT